MILRCPAYAPSPAISAEDITVDIYISPRELAEGGKPITENVALIVQAFGEHLVIPHLHRYQKMCLAAGVVPLPAPGNRSFFQAAYKANSVNKHPESCFW